MFHGMGGEMNSDQVKETETTIMEMEQRNLLDKL